MNMRLLMTLRGTGAAPQNISYRDGSRPTCFMNVAASQ